MSETPELIKTIETPELIKTIETAELIKTIEPIKTQTEALQILISALQLAQSRGVFKIGESARIAQAIVLFRDTSE